MTVKLFVGTGENSAKPEPFQFFHEQYPGAIRILRQLWAKLHPLDETSVIMVEVNTKLPENGWFKPDMVIMTPRGIGILEQKHYGGEILMGENGRTWFYTKSNGQQRPIRGGNQDNPAKQVLGYWRNFRNTLTRPTTRKEWLVSPATEYETFYRRVGIQSAVCFTNPTADTIPLEDFYESIPEGTQFSILDIERVLAWVQSLRLGEGIHEYIPGAPSYEMSLHSNILPMIRDLLGGVEWEEAYDWMPQIKPYATLIEFAPGGKQKYFQLARDEVLVGRGNLSENAPIIVDITIDEDLWDRGISRKHFEVERLGTFTLLHNHSPRVPIWVNGKEVLPGESAFLKDGDSITILKSLSNKNEPYYIFNRPAAEPMHTA